VVIELLESIEADDEVMAACRRLKRGGYSIALDDFVDRDQLRPLLPFADFVKVDVLDSERQEWHALPARLSSLPAKVLAEKVETREVFDEAIARGYKCFQGYFFSRPSMIARRDVPGFRLNYMRLLEELQRPKVSLDRIEMLVKQEASIAYRLLRRVNSAARAFRTEVRSIRHALVLLGQQEVRTCAMVWTIAELGRDQPAELVLASSVRARVAELLAPHAGCDGRASDLFLLGLFSMLDALMQQPMEVLAAGLPVATDVRCALEGGPNRLRDILDCVIAYERADWEQFTALALQVGVDESRVAACYMDAFAWSRTMFQGA
jgi:EAL and modified HD-GYP domain-containing signal transduction protein